MGNQKHFGGFIYLPKFRDMEKFSVEAFEDTEIAFQAKSDWKLKKALFLFSVVKNPTISKVMTSLVKLFPIKPLIKATVFEHFCGGETIEESEKTIQELANYNVQTILDYSVEGAHDESSYDGTMEEIRRTIRNASEHSEIPFSVFKVSGIAPVEVLEKVQLGTKLSESEQSAYSRAMTRIDELCKTAYSAGVPIFIDAEDSWYQDVIDQAAFDAMARYNREQAIVYNTFQMYRHDAVDRLKQAIEGARAQGYYFGAKLVRGAYMEIERERSKKLGYADPICENKAATDESYNNGLRYCVENIDIVSLANCTHNEFSSVYLTELMNDLDLPKDDKRFFFAQLYGMSDNISFNLANAGFNVGKYVPYGPVKKVMPYLIRRADENTSVAGQSTRELTLLKKERTRRKGAS